MLPRKETEDGIITDNPILGVKHCPKHKIYSWSNFLAKINFTDTHIPRSKMNLFEVGCQSDGTQTFFVTFLKTTILIHFGRIHASSIGELQICGCWYDCQPETLFKNCIIEHSRINKGQQESLGYFSTRLKKIRAKCAQQPNITIVWLEIPKN